MSVAVTQTVVVPMANVEPGFIEYVICGSASASVAVAGAKFTTAPDGIVASTTRFGLTDVITGGVESWTKTMNVAVEVFPYASVAVIVTGVGSKPSP